MSYSFSAFASQVYTIFAEEMASVSRELAARASVMQPALCYHPKYGGQAHYYRLLKRRIENSMMVSACRRWVVVVAMNLMVCLC
jgi:hypothetical protein